MAHMRSSITLATLFELMTPDNKKQGCSIANAWDAATVAVSATVYLTVTNNYYPI